MVKAAACTPGLAHVEIMGYTVPNTSLQSLAPLYFSAVGLNKHRAELSEVFQAEGGSEDRSFVEEDFNLEALMYVAQGLRGRLLWETVVYTSSYGAHLSPVPSGDQSVSPATPGASASASLSIQQETFRLWKQFSRAAAPITPEVSLERLILLLHYLGAWTFLPNISRWVLHTAEKASRSVPALEEWNKKKTIS